AVVGRLEPDRYLRGDTRGRDAALKDDARLPILFLRADPGAADAAALPELEVFGAIGDHLRVKAGHLVGIGRRVARLRLERVGRHMDGTIPVPERERAVLLVEGLLPIAGEDDGPISRQGPVELSAEVSDEPRGGGGRLIVLVEGEVGAEFGDLRLGELD